MLGDNGTANSVIQPPFTNALVATNGASSVTFADTNADTNAAAAQYFYRVMAQ